MKRVVWRRSVLFAVAAALAWSSLLGAAQLGSASTLLSFTVNTTSDTHDASHGDGQCSDSAGQCSLRAAIEESNAQPAGTIVTVSLPAGTYKLSLGTLSITANTITITGASSSLTIVKQNGSGAVMSVATGATATLAQLRLTGGGAGTPGGGLYNAGTTTLSHASVRSNTAVSGAGITNVTTGILTLTSTSVYANSVAAVADSHSGGSGGGIFNAGTLTLSGDTISANYAGEGGLGLNDTGGAGGNGGGISNTGTIRASSTKIIGNYAGTGGPGYNETPGRGGNGGGIYSSAGTVSLSSVTVSGNYAGQSGASETGDGAGTAGNGGGAYNAAKLTVSKSTFSSNNGATGAQGSDGAGIYNKGTATISSSKFTGNLAGSGYVSRAGYGGAIANVGTLTLTKSTLTGNSAGTGGTAVNGLPGGDGGGLYEGGGTAIATADTFNGNASGNGGPGLFVEPGFSYGGPGGTGGGIYSTATLKVSDSTLSGNTVGVGGANAPPLGGSGAPGIGGGVATAGGTASLLYTTVADNSDGIYTTAGTLTLTGMIVADSTGTNDRTGANCTGTMTETTGFNLDSGTTCNFSLGTDISGSEPLLGPLAANGGPTQTQALGSGSPAIDHGGPTASGCPLTDQRGVARPDETSDNGACDIGAYESQGGG